MTATLSPPSALAMTAEILWLDDPRAIDASHVGHKAARLAALRQAGFDVPHGFVVPALAVASWVERLERHSVSERDALVSALQAISGPVAVRSSGVAEDLGDASFAGQYETVLDVHTLEDLVRAIGTVARSATSARVHAYTSARGTATAPLAVLVQRMVSARASGVAFTVHPVSGARDVAVVSAVRGLGEALVSGSANAEEWEITSTSATRARTDVAVLHERDAVRVADLARRVAGTAHDAPTDIEWAFDGDALLLLQARPMTAIPDAPAWDAPVPGGWARHFRLGEWIGAPLTPLSESWLVTELEDQMHAHFERLFGIAAAKPAHVIVNGWYYYGLNTDVSGRSAVRALLTSLKNLPRHFREMAAVTPPLAHLGFAHEVRRWREQLLPAYRRDVAAAEQTLASLDAGASDERLRVVDRLICAASLQLCSIIGVAGYAAKVEGKLQAFWRKHVLNDELVVAELITGADATPAAHDVEGLDWCFPTLGERGVLPDGPSHATRTHLAERRRAAESLALSKLAAAQQRAFVALLHEARTAHHARQEQTSLFTLAWPAMRRALLSVGSQLVERELLAHHDDVWFCTRRELQQLVGAAPSDSRSAPPVRARRATWEHQRLLAPPLVIGTISGVYKISFDAMADAVRHDERHAADALCGMPGSTGRATGVARVIRRVDDLHRLQPGEILVAPVTTPAWTTAFARAAAIVTDTGSIASHASIVAREHGIPAVVGTGCGTTTIVDGSRITVDGGRGLVRRIADTAHSPGSLGAEDA